MSGWNSRAYRVVKVHRRSGAPEWWVVSEDLVDSDVWVVINEFDNVQQAWDYVREVTARNRELAE